MWWRHDLAAGLSVFLVALPLCLGIALASGAPLYAGLLAGIIGGIVTGFVSGASLAVSGPAAGLSTVVAATIASTGDFSIFLLSVIIAGAFQLLLGILRLGVIANYFPSAVIKGMLAAIGIILLMNQVPLALGYDQPDFWESGFLSLFSNKHFFGNLSRFSHHVTAGAIFIAVASLIVMILLQRPFAKKWAIIPAPLVVVLLGIGLQRLFALTNSTLQLKTSQLVNIPHNIFENIRFPRFSELGSNPGIWQTGIVIGVLASLETLLCIEGIDKLDRHNRITPVNREMMAQGIGNIFCGLLGAIPITAVVVRGAANIDAGAHTKLSAITHGVFILLTVLLIPSLINTIPYASLAAILLVTGYNLTKPKLFVNMWSLGWKQFLPFVITIVVILLTDLLKGVSIGLLLSVYFIIQNNFRSEYNIIKTQQQGIDSYLIKLNTNVTFLNKVNLKKTLDEVPEYSNLTIDGSECQFVDYDILEIISEYRSKAHDRHIDLRLVNIESVNISAIH